MALMSRKDLKKKNIDKNLTNSNCLNSICIINSSRSNLNVCKSLQIVVC